VLRADGVWIDDHRNIPVVRGATLDVRAGEIAGLLAVEGAGQHHLLRALTRRQSVSRGTLTTPARVGFIPEDRHRDALVVDFDLVQNVALRNASGHRGVMRWPRWRERTEAIMRRFDVRADGPHVAARTLSGGNQQRLVIGRELEDNPEALIVETPTRGLDIRATAAVHLRLREAAASGAAVVVYSSDIDEVINLADRLFVLHAGDLREVPVDRDIAGRAMLGLP